MSTIDDDEQRASADLRITLQHDPPGLIIDGDVDFKSLDAFTEALAAAADSHDGDVHLMLDGMMFIEVSGIRALIETSRRLAAQGRRLVLHGLEPQLRPVLDAVGWFDNTQEADRTQS